ncbi:hypothetical protein BT69DRAFT_1367720 [Atractiella rhizophila]|nr:hypothetical protein BT69DRAFT_1367720 [Atractiella rhizophila]
MHHPNLNFPQLIMGLWRGTIRPDWQGRKKTGKSLPWQTLLGNTWVEHGVQVANTRPYLPSSWDKFLRNIDIKFSAYKAKEWETYFYGVGPGLLQGIIAEPYYSHYIKIVYCIRQLRCRKIGKGTLDTVENLIIEYVEEFEKMYYQQDIARVHFCRPSLHKMLHHVPQVRRLGPFIYITQWTLERTIGILGSWICQPSNPYQNLSQQAVRQAQCQALRSLDPQLVHQQQNRLPRGSYDLHGGRAFLPASQNVKLPDSHEKRAIESFLMAKGFLVSEWNGYLTKWARLHLPSGEAARTLWKESTRPVEQVRNSCNIKASKQPSCSFHFGEVQYFFQLHIRDQVLSLALIKRYRDIIAHDIWGVVVTCQPAPAQEYEVIDVKEVMEVIAVIPRPRIGDRFIVEKLGLSVNSD